MEVLCAMKSAAEEKTSPVPPVVQRSDSTATTIPATAEELAAMGRKATHLWRINRSNHVRMY